MFNFNHSLYVEDEKVILKPGKCKFYIQKCEITKSKAGNEMLKLMLKVTDETGKSTIIFDYIGNATNMLWKLKHILEAINHPELFGADGIDPKFLEEKRGECIIQHETTQEYGKSNKIKDYVPVSKVKTVQDEPVEIEDDDLPF